MTYPEQNRGFWYINHLYPYVVDIYKKMCPDLSDVEKMLSELGFSDI